MGEVGFGDLLDIADFGRFSCPRPLWLRAVLASLWCMIPWKAGSLLHDTLVSKANGAGSAEALKT